MDRTPPFSAAPSYLSLPLHLSQELTPPVFLHVRAHASAPDAARDPERPSDRTIFVAGLPLGVNEEDIHTAVGGSCPVDAVFIERMNGARVAHVVFETPQGMKKFLGAARKGLATPLSCVKMDAYEASLRSPTRCNGLKKMIMEHRKRLPGNDVLQRQTDAWIMGFEAEKEKNRKAEEAQMEIEEGWTLVSSKKSRAKTVSSSGIVVGSIAKGRAAALRIQKPISKKNSIADDFYRFQKREHHRNQLLALREQFEEDKRKVAKLKAARKFRPT